MWKKGTIVNPKTGNAYSYTIKHFDEGSEYGINGGRISKLDIRMAGGYRPLASYDRGWDLMPTGEAETILAIILSKFN